MKLVKMDPAQSGEIAAFIARLQADKTHQIAYFGQEAAEITAALQTFDPPCNVLLAYEGDQLTGLLGVDTDQSNGRAWLYGPLVDFPEWHLVADALYEEALRRNVIPDFVHDEELFVDAGNRNIAAFAANHHFVPGTPQASLRLERSAFSAARMDGKEFELTPPHYQVFRQLHDSLFPGTYYSGRQITDRLGARDKVFVASIPELPDVPIGYIYAKIDPEAADGYIDFLGVFEPFRRRGIARRLITTAVHWLFAFPEIEAVTLTVDAANTAALALYTNLGFTHLQTLQSFRKRY